MRITVTLFKSIAMKKLFAYAATIAALIATVSCSQKELDSIPDVPGKTVNIRITSKSAGDTKTGVVYNAEDKKHSPYWNNGDQIGVFFDSFTGKTKLDAILSNTATDKSQTANFSAEDVTLNNSTIPGEEGKVYSFYPASAFEAVVAADNAVRVNLKSSQTPAAVDTYDPAADILVGQPSQYGFEENTFVSEIAFARVLSVVKISLTAGDECPENLAVNKLTMTAPEGTILTGRVKLSLNALYDEDSPLVDWTVKGEEVSAIYNDFKPIIGGTANTVYLIVNPTSIASGGDIKFTIDTDTYSIEKTVNLTKALAFPQGKVANINLSIAGTNCTAKVAETRIWVENFANVTVKEKQYQPNKTGAAGTGVNDNTSYDYGTDENTNIRLNSNGHSATDPYLFLRANSTFTVSNIAVSEQSDLILSAQTKNAGTVTLKYKESTAETWTEIGSWTSTNSFSEQNTIFDIAETATSIDLSFTTGGAAVIIDDFVLDKFVDTRNTLAAPANVTAVKDENTSNKINVTWDAVENAGLYEVTLSTAGEEDVVKESTTNSSNFTGLNYSTLYSVKVKAISSDVALYKDSEYSNPVNVTTGEQPAVTIDWVKKSFADLAAGDEVVIVKTSDTPYAMSNNNGTSNPPAAIEVSVSNDKLGAEPEANIIWYVGIDGSNKIFNKDKDGSTWLYCTGTNNGVRVGDNTNKTFTWDDKEYLKHVGTSRYLGVYNNQDWRCYSTTEPSTHTNLKDQTFAFFVKNDPRTALATPEITVTPNNTDKKITVSWNTVANAADYTVTCTGQTEKTVSGTECEFTELAYREYTVTVQANPADETIYKPSEKASKNVSIVDTTPVINAENPTAVEANATSIEVPYSVTNNVVGTNLTATVTTGDWISDPQVEDNKVTFTLDANTTSEQRTGTVTLSYAGAEDKVITITQKGAGQAGYASLEDLVAAGEPTGANVTVTFSCKAITKFQGTGDNRKGIYLSVQGAYNNEVEIYCNTVATPEEWAVGGWLSGTLTDCKWTKYNNTWELCPSNWDEIDHFAPVANPQINLTGANAEIICDTEGATILYAVSDDGNQPENITTIYNNSVTLTDGQTIWAKAIKTGFPESGVAYVKYTADGSTPTYKKVSSFTVGKKYILVVNNYSKIFDGGNVSKETTAIDATSLISNNEIESNSTTDSYAITIESSTTSGKYLLKLSTSKYLVINASTSKNGDLTSSDTGEAISINTVSGGFQFVSTNRSARGVCYRDGYNFRNYATSNFSSSGYSGTFTLYEYAE